mgnify:CR=1 FL=1
MKTINKILNHQLLLSLIILNTVIFILFSPDHFFFEMLQSMAFQISIGIIFLAIIFLVFRKWIGAVVSIIAIVLMWQNISYIKPNFSSKTLGLTNLTVAHYNVLKHNKNFENTIESIKNYNADLVSINEMTYDWNSALRKGLAETYPHQYLVPQKNSFGIAVFSKKELVNTETIWFEGIPYISGEILVNDTSVQFLTAHTIPPTSKYAYAKRNQEIKHIENFLSKTDKPKIVIGDFNAVSWSPAMRKLRQNLNLRDSRTSLQGTFPSWNKFLMIPIDHIFHSSEITCLSFKTISGTDSDHYGVIGRYRI